MRALNKSDVTDALTDADKAWLDYYVKGTGSQPFQGATAYTLTCPSSAPSGGPYQAGSWAGLSHGVVRFLDSGSKTISASGGDSSVDATFDPVQNGAGGNACQTAPGDDINGVASYRLPAAAGSGYTLLGSPTVVATIANPVANSEMAVRLLDVDPSGTETLVARQLYRPQVGTSRQVFELHPEWTPLRARPRREAGAAAEGCRRRVAEQLRPSRERPGRHHGLEPRPAAARVG